MMQATHFCSFDLSTSLVYGTAFEAACSFATSKDGRPALESLYSNCTWIVLVDAVSHGLCVGKLLASSRLVTHISFSQSLFCTEPLGVDLWYLRPSSTCRIMLSISRLARRSICMKAKLLD